MISSIVTLSISTLLLGSVATTCVYTYVDNNNRIYDMVNINSSDPFEFAYNGLNDVGDGLNDSIGYSISSTGSLFTSFSNYELFSYGFRNDYTNYYLKLVFNYDEPSLSPYLSEFVDGDILLKLYLRTDLDFTDYFYSLNFSFYSAFNVNGGYANCVCYFSNSNDVYRDSNGYSYYIYTSSVNHFSYVLDSYLFNTYVKFNFDAIKKSYLTGTSFEDGYNEGFYNGKNAGYEEGVRDSSSATSLFFTIADTPVVMIRSLFNFQFLGINFFYIIVSLITLLFVLFVIKKVIK